MAFFFNCFLLKKFNNPDPFIISGSNILEGNGYGIVCCVGINSHLGKLRQNIEKNKSNYIPYFLFFINII